MRGMSETTEPSIPPPPATPAPVIAPAAPHSERLYQVAAWVAIVAGVTLIAVVILKFVLGVRVLEDTSDSRVQLVVGRAMPGHDRHMTQAPEPPIQSPAGPPAPVIRRDPALPPLSRRGVGGDRRRHLFVLAVVFFAGVKFCRHGQPYRHAPHGISVPTGRTARPAPRSAVGGVPRRAVFAG